MGYGQWGRQRLRRAGVNFIVQGCTLRVLVQMVLGLHVFSLAIIVPHNEQRHPKVPL
jgi:hypothetical protein